MIAVPERIARSASDLSDFLRKTGQLVGHCHTKLLRCLDPMRWIVEYTIDTNDGESIKYVGKFFECSTQGEHSYSALATLDQAIREQNSRHLRVPEPLYYDGDHQVLMQSFVPGQAWTSVSTEQRQSEFMELAGQALAELHRLPICSETLRDFAPSPKGWSDHLHDLVAPDPGELARRIPQSAPVILRTLDFLHAKLDQVLFQAVPIHRDYQLRQLFVDSRHVWVVDWDLYAWGDPRFDVSYMTAYLRSHTGTIFGQLREAFLRGYQRGSGPAETTADALLPYEVFNYLRRACRRYRIQDLHWQAELEQMLEFCDEHV